MKNLKLNFCFAIAVVVIGPLSGQGAFAAVAGDSDFYNLTDDGVYKIKAKCTTSSTSPSSDAALYDGITVNCTSQDISWGDADGTWFPAVTTITVQSEYVPTSSWTAYHVSAFHQLVNIQTQDSTSTLSSGNCVVGTGGSCLF